MLLLIWPASGLLTLLLYAAVAFRYDRRFVVSTWIKLWLAVMLLLGPVGTLLTGSTLWQIVRAVRRELRELNLTSYPRLRSHAVKSHPNPQDAVPAGALLADLHR